MKRFILSVLLIAAPPVARAGTYYSLAQNASSATMSVGGNITLGATTTGTQKITFDGLTGSVTASAFFGSGSGLTNMASNSAFAAKASSGTNADISTLQGAGGLAVTISTALTVAAFGGNITIGAMNSGGAICVNGSPTTATCQGMAESNTGDQTLYIMSPHALYFDFAGVSQDMFSTDGSVVFASTLTVQTGSIIVSASSVTASAFFGDGSHLSNTSLPVTITSSLTFSGATAFLKSNSSITASAFFGSGAALTGVIPSGAAGGELAGTYPNPTLASTSTSLYALTSSSGLFIGGSGANLSTGLNIQIYGGMYSTATSASEGFVSWADNRTKYMMMGNTGAWGIRTGSDQGFNLDSSANTTLPALSVNPLNAGVGIATAAAQSTLDVNGSAQFGKTGNISTFNVVGALFINSGSSITLTGAGGYLKSSSSITASAFFGDGAGLVNTGASFTGGAVANPITAASSMTITANGFSVGTSTFAVKGSSVGIGTATPAAKLHLSSGSFLIDGLAGSLTINTGTVTVTVSSQGWIDTSGGPVPLLGPGCGSTTVFDAGSGMMRGHGTTSGSMGNTCIFGFSQPRPANTYCQLYMYSQVAAVYCIQSSSMSISCDSTTGLQNATAGGGIGYNCLLN